MPNQSIIDHLMYEKTPLTYGKNGLDHIWKTNGNSIWMHASYFKWPFNKGDRQYKKAVGVTAFA